MFKVDNKASERRHWRRSGVLIVNFEHSSHLFILFLLFEFEQVNVSWGASDKNTQGDSFAN